MKSDNLGDITCTIGVGDGSGSLFVHGDYESIKRVQSMIFELEKLRSENEELKSKPTLRESYNDPRGEWHE